MTQPTRSEGYAPLRDYAVIGDGRTVALVARDGQIDWFPIPDLASPPPFAALVDAQRGGRFALRPTVPFTVDRHYVEHTNVLRTRFSTDAGTVDVVDALVTGVAGRLPWTQLVRRIEGVDGAVPMAWSVEPGDVFGGEAVHRADGVAPILQVGRLGIAVVEQDAGRQDGAAVAQDADAAARFFGAFVTQEGSRHLLCLTGATGEPIRLPAPDVADRSIERTIDNWQQWFGEYAWSGGWRDQVERSVLALKALIHSPTGAIAAAATTSLPESRVTPKNWDYRYAWVRDLSFTVDALLRFGLREEPHAAVSWLLRALERSSRKGEAVFFDLAGRSVSGVEVADAEGWAGIGPVVTGNTASGQLQTGGWSDVIELIASYVEDGAVIDTGSSELIVRLADETCDRWRRKDNGIWELPVRRHYVSSKMGCWKALEAACRLHDAGHLQVSSGTRRRWEKAQRRIRRWVDEHGWDERRGSYVMYEGGDLLDASVLLHALRGFDRGERMSRTIDALRAELGSGPLLYRYSGMREEEGAFVACSFWMAAALECVGRHDEAVAAMDEMVGLVNDVGLLAEMVEEGTGAFLGNLPQALSHLALIQAAGIISQNGR